MKRGAILSGLNTETISNITIVLPPATHQKKLMSFIQTETTKLDDLTTEAQHTIDLLKERRSALISAAVTGKIDVRGYDAQSPRSD